MTQQEIKQIKNNEEQTTIYIRSFFEWKVATVEKAFEFCNKMLLTGLPNVPKEKRIERLDKYHLKGITYIELMKQVSNK